MTAETLPSLGFEALGLSSFLLNRLNDMGFETPTDIQKRTIPFVLEGRDVVGQAQTGTGKTAAFGLPLLSRIESSSNATQVLVLTPTRELAIQVADALDEFARGMKAVRILPIFGGQDYGIQIRGLKRGAHVVVGTPGRVMDHMRKGTLDLSTLKAVVLDEADEMLKMGFVEDVEWVMARTPEGRQVTLFSATMPPPIRRIANTYLVNPEVVSLAGRSVAAATIEQRYCVVPAAHKTEVLVRILEDERTDGVIVFARTKADTVSLGTALRQVGLGAQVLNGDMAQALRERTVDQFKNGGLDILVATDVAARGLDVDRISHVINFDPPRDAETYVHRIGRTGRAGRKGKAILMLSSRDRRTLQNVSGKTGQTIEPMEIPSAEKLNRARIVRFADDIGEALTDKSTRVYRDIISKIVDANDNTSAFDVAVALASMLRKDRPLLLEELPASKSFRQKNAASGQQRDRGKDRGPRRSEQRRSEQRHEDENMERYTVQVGSAHGLNPSHLVGAIANEADLSSKHIGRIDIYKEYSTVDLPMGMPEATFKLLKKVIVCKRPLKLRRVAPNRSFGNPSSKHKGKRPGRAAV
jgi:ATP-dependent RNA helicase DeaD